MSKKKKRTIYAAGAFFVIVGFLLLWALYPRNLTSLVGLNIPISRCYVLVEGMPPEPSVDLTEDDLQHLLELFRSTSVQLCGRNDTISSSIDEILYRLYFSTDTKQFDVLIISENHHVYFNGNEYKILGENKANIVSLLRKSVHV